MQSIQLLPAELICHIGRSCSQSDLRSLALVNRNFYQNLISILYKGVHLNTRTKIKAFHYTVSSGRTPFRVHLETIYITLPHIDNPDLIARLIREILASTPQLIDLTLRISSDMIAVIFYSLQCQFLLRRLSVRPIPHMFFRNFLERQTHIIDLCLQNGTPRKDGDRSIPSTTLRYLDPSALPNLQVVTAKRRNVLSLVSGRPVTSIHVTSIVSPGDLPPFGASLVDLPVQLRFLRISISLREFSINDATEMVISNVGHCLGSLELFKLGFYLPMNDDNEKGSTLEILKVNILML